MVIQFFEDTNIRLRPDDLSDANIVGQVFAPATLEVEDDVKTGASIDGNNRWFRDRNGWFYWSGRANVVQSGAKTAAPPPVAEVVLLEKELVEATVLMVIGPAAPDVFLEKNTVPGNSGTGNFSVRSKFVADPAFPNLDDFAGAAGIPDGETRPAVFLKTEETSAQESFSITAPEAESSENESFFILKNKPDAPATTRSAPLPTPVFVEKNEVVGGEQKVVVGDANNGPSTTPPQPETQNSKPETQNWGIQSLGIPGKFWQRGITGRGIKIAILSTGTDLTCTDLDEAIEGVFLGENCGDSMQDTDGIGTQAAVAAAGRGIGLAGVAPGASLFIGKIGTLDRLITPESLLEGLDWAISSGADIIAMMVDFPRLSDEMERLFSEKIALATAQKILLLAPVGNSTDKTPQRRYPAAWPEVLSVGAHDRSEQRSHFSAKSYELDLLAPGEGLASMGLGNQIFSVNAPSTAIATAFVAGVLALLKAAERSQPQFFPAEKTFFDLLKESAFSPKNHVEKGEDVDFGHGLLRIPSSF